MILGSYSRLSMQLILSRKITYHLFRTYLPSGLFVVIGWFSLYIPIEHVPGRVTMGMTTILTLAAMFSAIATTTPRVSYRCYYNNFWDIKCLVYWFNVTLLAHHYILFLPFQLEIGRMDGVLRHFCLLYFTRIRYIDICSKANFWS